MQGLNGREGKHSTTVAKQHKDDNRFGNILVCKYIMKGNLMFYRNQNISLVYIFIYINR